MSRPAAIVIAKAPRPGLCKTRLEPLLGPGGCARLQAALVARAAAWATAVGDAYVVFTPDDARDEIAALAPGATLIPQVDGSLGDRLAAAFRGVLSEHPGPALLVGVDTPQLGPAHADAALDDLRDGIDVTVGPASDGGYYLIGLREPHDAVFALPSELWGGSQVLVRTLEAASIAGLSIAMLRAERDLDDADDARAMLADPLTAPDIVAALRRET
ncbi:MAG TPA: TIGR04282 family arsenosugar biosynthesis glycosyltransferase [Solirubrobacteraceae bacterium]|nr:TIGR04282 family arsenosugar biosynthesis glycosyltransferase [Solirubrobacteraceae bacterium]